MAQTPKMISLGHGHIKTAGTSMARLAAGLSRELHRPVIDKTGLPNIYVVDLQYAPPDAVETDSVPSLFTALREAGLLLRPVKAQIEIIKVDRANANPTPNKMSRASAGRTTRAQLYKSLCDERMGSVNQEEIPNIDRPVDHKTRRRLRLLTRDWSPSI
jgi:hypothetical protein